MNEKNIFFMNDFWAENFDSRNCKMILYKRRHISQLSQLQSLPTMNFFQSVRKFYETLGICSLHLNQTYFFNVKIFFFYFVIAFVWISEIAFCLFEAASVADYGKSFYAFVTQFSLFWGFLTTIWLISNILKLIGRYEMFIAKSKWHGFWCLLNVDFINILFLFRFH